jgi:hypothetical protein
MIPTYPELPALQLAALAALRACGINATPLQRAATPFALFCECVEVHGRIHSAHMVAITAGVGERVGAFIEPARVAVDVLMRACEAELATPRRGDAMLEVG